MILAHVGLPCELHDPGFWTLLFAGAWAGMTQMKLAWSSFKTRFSARLEKK